MTLAHQKETVYDVLSLSTYPFGPVNGNVIFWWLTGVR